MFLKVLTSDTFIEYYLDDVLLIHVSTKNRSRLAGSIIKTGTEIEISETDPYIFYIVQDGDILIIKDPTLNSGEFILDSKYIRDINVSRTSGMFVDIADNDFVSWVIKNGNYKAEGN